MRVVGHLLVRVVVGVVGHLLVRVVGHLLVRVVVVVVRLRVGRLPVHRVVKHGCLWLDLDPGARRGQARAKLHRQVLCVDRQIAGDRRPYRPRRGRQRLVEPQLEAGVGGPDLAAAIEQGALRELEQSLGRRPQIVERVRRRTTA